MTSKIERLEARLDKVIKATANDCSWGSKYALIDLLYIKTGRHPSDDKVYEWAKQLGFRK